MCNLTKRLLKWFIIIALLGAAGYGGYRLYNYLVQDATERIKKGAAEGVSEGIGKGIVGTLNPFTWPSKLFN